MLYYTESKKYRVEFKKYNTLLPTNCSDNSHRYRANTEKRISHRIKIVDI